MVGPMRHEWTDEEGKVWYAKDGTTYGAEFGRVVNGYDEEVNEGDPGAESPLPEPAIEILRLAARVIALEAENARR